MADQETNMFAYYMKQARDTGYNLSLQVRERNEIQINPKVGKDLFLMPVFEENQVSLHSITREICETEIMVVDKEPMYVDAYWKRYLEKNTVILTDHNYCWSRFYACKELMHCYLYDTGQEALTLSSLHKLILELTADSTLTPEHPSRPRIVDEVAYYGALAYLLPNDVMPLLSACIEKLSEEMSKDDAILMTAISMRVPKIALEFRLDSNEFD